MDVYDRLIGKMVREISRLDAYIDLNKDNGDMLLQLNAKKEAYQKVIGIIKDDEYEWG